MRLLRRENEYDYLRITRGSSTKSLALQWLFRDPLISFLSIAAAIAVIVGLLFYALASGLISF